MIVKMHRAPVPRLDTMVLMMPSNSKRLSFLRMVCNVAQSYGQHPAYGSQRSKPASLVRLAVLTLPKFNH
jgi:hypothetical protein